MNIISWNVNGLRALHKKGAFDSVFELQPDILCLQEIKAHKDQLPLVVQNVPGFISFFDHAKVKKGYSGVSVYTKVAPIKVEYGIGVPDLDQEGRSITLFFENMALNNTYFPNGGGGPDRLAFKLRYYDSFLLYINKIKERGIKVIFCGDVNTAHTEIDLARPKENEKNTGFLPEERAWIDRVISFDFIDVYRHFYPLVKNRYTYWDMKTFARDRNVGWRIDYFFVSKNVLTEVKKVAIHDTVMGSDHCPISIVL